MANVRQELASLDTIVFGVIWNDVNDNVLDFITTGTINRNIDIIVTDPAIGTRTFQLAKLQNQNFNIRSLSLNMRRYTNARGRDVIALPGEWEIRFAAEDGS